MPCVSPPVYDDSNDEDDGNEEDDNDNNEEDNNDKTTTRKTSVTLTWTALMACPRIRCCACRGYTGHRNHAKLVSLGLLGGMTSAASPSADRTNRKKRVAMQGDFVRRI